MGTWSVSGTVITTTDSMGKVSMSDFCVNGNTATFSGTCTKNGNPCTFTVTVQDNGEPGKNVDTFTISVSGEPTEGGTITNGNIQVH